MKWSKLKEYLTQGIVEDSEEYYLEQWYFPDGIVGGELDGIETAELMLAA